MNGNNDTQSYYIITVLKWKDYSNLIISIVTTRWNEGATTMEHVEGSDHYIEFY